MVKDVEKQIDPMSVLSWFLLARSTFRLPKSLWQSLGERRVTYGRGWQNVRPLKQTGQVQGHGTQQDASKVARQLVYVIVMLLSITSERW